MSEQAAADVVRVVLIYGVNRIREERLRSADLRAMQAATEQYGAFYETLGHLEVS